MKLGKAHSCLRLGRTVETLYLKDVRYPPTTEYSLRVIPTLPDGSCSLALVGQASNMCPGGTAGSTTLAAMAHFV